MKTSNKNLYYGYTFIDEYSLFDIKKIVVMK